jgi:iron-sulfur cluster repair protein YtfE (RIC family)
MRELMDCHSIVAYVRADHARIRKSLQTVVRTFRETDPHAPRREIALVMIELLTSLLAQLRRHFAEEQEGGSLEEAVCRCPSLSPEVRQLDEAHPELLTRLETLIARLRDPQPSRGITSEDHRLLDEFAQQLQRHEAAENNILSRAFGGQFGEDAI